MDMTKTLQIPTSQTKPNSAHHETTSSFDGSVTCNLCGQNNFSILFKPGEAQINQVVTCNHCSLMYANPRAKPPAIVQLKKCDPGLETISMDPWRVAKEKRQVRDFRNTRAHLSKMFPERGHLVEVGCGLGYLLNFFKEDRWRVEGLEPWVQGCRYAYTNFGIKVHPTTLEAFEMPEASILVLMMMHVIEHVPDPLATFTEANRVLKQGGMFVVETPRYDSLMFKLLGKRERSMSCNGHIYFFTTDTLRQLGEKAGFRLIRVMYTGRSLNLERLAWNVGVISKNSTVRKFIQAVSKKFHFNKVPLYMNFRDMQRMYFVK